MLDHRLGEGAGPDLLASGAKAAPPVVVSLLTAGGMTLQDWVLLMTLVYTVLQIAWLLFKAWRSLSADDAGDDA